MGSDGNYEPMLTLIHTLKQIKPEAPEYFVAGDDDPEPVGAPRPGARRRCWPTGCLPRSRKGAVYLDAPVRQEVGKYGIWFVPEYLYDLDAAGMVKSLTKQKEDMEALGQQYEAEGGASYRALCYRLDAMERTVAAQQEMLSTDLQIAVTHVPLIQDYIRTSLEWADEKQVFSFRTISLLLTGHYCGGQWRVPGVGALYEPELGWFPPGRRADGACSASTASISIFQAAWPQRGASAQRGGCSTAPALRCSSLPLPFSRGGRHGNQAFLHRGGQRRPADFTAWQRRGRNLF